VECTIGEAVGAYNHMKAYKEDHKVHLMTAAIARAAHKKGRVINIDGIIEIGIHGMAGSIEGL
jgi:hypothetical protein